MLAESYTISELEINKHIAWLENEINLCHEYDLPSGHFVKELNELNKVNNIRKEMNEQYNT